MNAGSSLFIIPFWEPLPITLALRHQLMLTNRRGPMRQKHWSDTCFVSLMPVSLIDPGTGEAGEEGIWEERGGMGGGFLIIAPIDFTFPFCKPHQTFYYLLNIVFSTRSYLFNVLFSFYTICPMGVKTMSSLLIAISQTPRIVPGTQ